MGRIVLFGGGFARDGPRPALELCDSTRLET
jgi:hypothetical protein